jgi:hypothetical protein
LRHPLARADSLHVVAALWFDRNFGRLTRRGGLLYAALPGELWAVHRQELYTEGVPEDLAQQGRETLGHYGALASGTAHLLIGDEITLPPSLHEWGFAPDRPAAELGGWEPTLITIDGGAHLALRRDLDELRVFATTFGAEHLLALTPASEEVVRLVFRDDLDAPAPGWDQFGP